MRVCIRVFGIVQGVGFRPTVKRHADVCRIEGSVSNKGPYVEIFAQGRMCESLYKEDSGAAAETSSYLKDGCGKSGICNRV